MLISIPDVIAEAALSAVFEQTSQLVWRDGGETAGRVARQVKRNLQADLSTRAGAKLRDALATTIVAHPVLRAAAQPRRLVRLLLSKTLPGGGYGYHVDSPHMETSAGQVRTDLSFTLFLSAPDAYEGGELVIEQAGMTHWLKPAAGDLVLYPSTNLHEVRTVTAGERIVCAGWIESWVRAADDREVLFDLENLRTSLTAVYDLQSPEMLTLQKVIANLTRRLS